MKKTLLNRLVIILAIVVSTATVFGIVHFTRTRHTAPVVSLQTDASPGSDSSSENGPLEAKAQAPQNPKQNVESKKPRHGNLQPSEQNKRVASVKKDTDANGEKSDELDGGREQEPISEEGEAGAAARENWYY